MEENIKKEEGRKTPQPKKRIVLFVIATFAILVAAFCTYFVWSINFQEIVDTAKSGDFEDAMAVIMAILMLSVPFLAAGVINVLIALIFGPLCLAKLRKSSIKVLSILGIVYGLAFFGTAIASVAKIVMDVMGPLSSM